MTYNYQAELKDCYALWERRLQAILYYRLGRVRLVH